MKLQDIDVHFDVQTDSKGKDPDSASPTLRAYHQLLWSKPLPNGQEMKLGIEKNCLKWGDMWFGCDSITASFLHWRFPLKECVEQHISNFAEWKKDYWHKTYTIGGSIIFPMHRWSMNQARGCSVKICDRWDLTLECIRRFYAGDPSPLDKVFATDREFFNLFVDFKGYVDFFLLQDCVSDDYSKVDIWCGDASFVKSGLPETIDDYFTFIDEEFDFLDKRNQRIKDYCQVHNL